MFSLPARLTRCAALIELAFHCVGRKIIWQGEGIDEVGIDDRSGHELIMVDPKYFRPAEVDLLLGDCSKSKRELGWVPATDFKELTRIMVEHDLELARNEMVSQAQTK